MSMESLVNLTPHALTVRHENKEWRIESSGSIRVATKREEIPYAFSEGIPLFKQSFGEVVFPEGLILEKGKIYAVSLVVLQAIKDSGLYQEYTFVAPDTGPTAIRKDGMIEAVTGFVC